MERVAALYRDHFKFVWRVVWRARVPAGDIDDVAQDVFLVVLHKPLTDEAGPGRASTPSLERAQLFTITKYELKNYRRRAHVRRTEPMDDHINEIADARNDAARIEDRDQLLALLDSTEASARAVFELVELEDFSVVDAARCLEITEAVAHKRLAVARKDIEAAVRKLAQRDEEAGKKATSPFLLPFGEGAWLNLRDMQGPPAGTSERIWKRIQAKMDALEQETTPPASSPARPAPPRSRDHGAPRLARSVQSPWGYVAAAIGGGLVVALLLLLRTNTHLAILRIPGPVVLMPSACAPSTATPDPLLYPPVPATAEARTAADAALAEERILLRRARASFVEGDLATTRAAIKDYETRYPTGRLRQNIESLRASLPDAGAR